MITQEIHYCGTLRISNPNTLQKWIDSGRYQKQIDAGYTFNVGCGRFKFGEVCTCSKCRKLQKPELREILSKYEKTNNI